MSSSPRVVAIVQARMGSSRLPSKTLEVLFDKPLLEHIVERLRASSRLADIVIATTENETDNRIAELAERLRLGLHRGSDANVLERFHGAASKHGAQVVVRVTADDPFKDPEVIDYGVDLLLKENYDYCSNTIAPTYPEGLDIEVFRFSALERAYREARLDSEKEHVTPYIWKHPDAFRLFNFSLEKDLSSHRWTIDYPADLQFAREVYARLYPRKRIFLMQDILDLLRTEPALRDLNSGIQRNEGYLKSVQRESTYE